MLEWRLIQVDRQDADTAYGRSKTSSYYSDVSRALNAVYLGVPIPTSELENLNKTKELRKELGQTKRLLRKVVRLIQKQGMKDAAKKEIPELGPRIGHAVEAWKRLRRVREARKQRLLREMRPEDLRALGLTPPQREPSVENNPYNLCRRCHRIKSAHFGAGLFCNQTANLDKYDPA